jgi:hydroxymethylbilane synthase
MAGNGCLRIGTRHSDLATWQAETVAGLIRALPDGPDVELVFIKTEGDRITDVPLHAVPGKAFFTKEIEAALIDGTVDLAVHSLKDLATVMPDGLGIAAVLEREDPRDALLTRDGKQFDELPAGARVGTSSLRRRAQLARWRPDVEIVDLRGNVPTRIRKLEDGVYDAIVLAAAGVRRLGLTEHVSELLPTDRVLPAVSQGAVAVQIRAADEATHRWTAPLDHPATRAATNAERAVLRTLEGGCQVPVAALAELDGDALSLRGMVCALDGSTAVTGTANGSAADAEVIGNGLAADLAARGGADILAAIRAAEDGTAS